MCSLPVSASWITCQIAKPAETPDPRGPSYSKGWTNTMDTIPFLPNYAVVAAFRRGFFSCLENWNADSEVGLGNSLLNNSRHKLLPPFPKLAAIWGTATGLRIQENQDFFHLCFISMCDFPQIRNGFKNRENILGFMTEQILTDRGERVFSEPCKHGNPLLCFQKGKGWTDL